MFSYTCHFHWATPIGLRTIFTCFILLHCHRRRRRCQSQNTHLDSRQRKNMKLVMYSNGQLFSIYWLWFFFALSLPFHSLILSLYLLCDCTYTIKREKGKKTIKKRKIDTFIVGFVHGMDVSQPNRHNVGNESVRINCKTIEYSVIFSTVSQIRKENQIKASNVDTNDDIVFKRKWNVWLAIIHICTHTHTHTGSHRMGVFSTQLFFCSFVFIG